MEGVELTVDQPDFLKPEWEATAGSVEDETELQPDRLSAGAGAVTGSTVMFKDVAGAGSEVGLAILMPAAAAIFLNSFSSRFRSFSLRLSTSSWGTMR